MCLMNSWQEGYWLPGESPGNERGVTVDLFLPFQPQRHLCELILEVGGIVRILRKVNAA